MEKNCIVGWICIDHFTLYFREVKDFLGDKPFHDYQQTMYFARYLQWKWLERYDCLWVKYIVYSTAQN